MGKKFRPLHFITNISYIIGCVILFLISILIISSAVFSIGKEVFGGQFSVYNILDEVGLIVFAIAVLDVGKYLFIEEVLERSKDQKNHREMRYTLTKLAVIIATALSLEGLVLTIEMAKTDIRNIPYSVAVLITATIYIVGLGVYQKLNSSSEKNGDTNL